MRKLNNIAAQLKGSIVDVESVEMCETHGVAIVRQQLIAEGTVVEGSICPFASTGECTHTEQVTWIISTVAA